MSSLSIPPHTPSPSSSQYKSPCASPHSEDSNPPPQPTPNVYINGLPPHFSEDNLFALAAPFGTVRSVRSFTRFVGERSSGYGFVLFDTVEAAEKCIDALRRYRNLHPSFSKQIHKIPGTVYATSAGSNRTASDSGGGEGNAAETFKAKMERLQDESSTNLYFEGLPLSIDDPTLAALVSPYAIKSSRFFQTKLSHPPRIIAFVRLETRAAAEEIIERLHGRMVRGWNDPGSRISVRFADTSEQRELRRSERTARDGDQSPARLTIAQAALLNLRGQELQPHPNMTTLHPRTSPQHPVLRLPASYPHPLPATLPLTLPDYGHTFGGYTSGGTEYPLPSRSGRPAYQYSTMDANMKVLLESLRRSGVPFAGNGNEGYAGPEYMHQTARNGFTPAEELIFQAHAYPGGTRERGSIPQPQISERIAQSVVGMTEDDFHSNAGYLGRVVQYGSLEEGARRVGTMYNRHIHPAHVNARLAQAREVDGVGLKQVQQEQHTVSYQNQQVQSREKQQQQQQQQQQQHSQNNIQNQNQNQNEHNHTQHNPNHNQNEHIQTQNQNQTHAHIRSTTLPHRSSSSSHVHQRHHQHSSMSIPSGTNNNSNSNNNSNHNGRTQNDGQNNRDQVQCIFENEQDGNNNMHTNTAGGNEESNNKSNGTYERELHEYLTQGRQEQKVICSAVYDDIGIGSPPLVSPALTYSSRTPTTMSPATPFFGSFEVK